MTACASHLTPGSSAVDRVPSTPPYLRLDFWGLIHALTFAAVWFWSPVLTFIPTASALVMTARPLSRAWKGSRGLPLRPMIAWGCAAVTLALMGQISQFQDLAQPLTSGRPVAGHFAYLSSLATIAALISTLGARKPGHGAWSILMGLLVLILLIPWMEDFGLSGRANPLSRLRLDAPWSIFYGILVVAGVTNYLFTRYAGASILIGAGLLVEYVALLNPSWPPPRRAVLWSLGPLLGAWGILRAECEARSRSEPAAGLAAVWLWFRDHWGVVWALRVRERFNRAAEVANWPVRLAWNGVTDPRGGSPGPIPPEAVRTLEMLLRRFAPVDRLAVARGASAASPCPDPDAAGE